MNKTKNNVIYISSNNINDEKYINYFIKNNITVIKYNNYLELENEIENEIESERKNKDDVKLKYEDYARL